MQLDTEITTVKLQNPKQRRAQYRAPREHGRLLAVPPLSQAAALLEINQRRRVTQDAPIGSTTVGQLGEQARTELIAEAVRHTSAYRELATPGPDPTIIMSGHQPELFHPGVWVKNFALDRLAKEHHAVAVQLLVDNDDVGQVAVKVPIDPALHPEHGADDSTARVQDVIIQSAPAAVPYEERWIRDPQEFDQAGSRIAASIGEMVADPIVNDLWPYAIDARRRYEQQDGAANLGLVLAEARHLVERDWGLNTLEVPLSKICQGSAFRLFAAHLLDGLDALHPIYNQSLLDYRCEHRLRSNSHPAPLLATDGQFREAPFWVWTANDAQRKPLFAGHQDDALVLKAGPHGPAWSIECNEGSGVRVERIAHRLAVAETEAGIKIRPRALITTLFARLLLCDLFLHGIGGGKYDQVTDQLARDIFGCEPPEFMVVSATLQLPCARVPVERDDIRQLDGLLRELWYHPENNAEQVTPENSLRFAELAVDKQSLLAQQPQQGTARAWHLRLEDTNEKLRSFLAERRTALQRERNRLTKRLAADKIFSSREYSFCLFSTNALRSVLRRQVQQ